MQHRIGTRTIVSRFFDIQMRDPVGRREETLIDRVNEVSLGRVERFLGNALF